MPNRTVIRHTKFTPTGNIAKSQTNGPLDKYRKLLDRQKIDYTEETINIDNVELRGELREHVRDRTRFMKWIIEKKGFFRFNCIQPGELVTVFTF